MRLKIASLAVVFALGALMVPGGASAASCAMPGQVAQMRDLQATQINQLRAGAGLPALRRDARLEQAAQLHACFLAQTGEMSHRGQGGSNSMARARASGFPARLVAENLAFGYRDAARVVNLWYGSPGHHRNMMHPRVSQYGVGVAEGPRGPMWVLLVGS